MIKQCEYCKKDFEAKRNNTRYCSRACNKKQYYIDNKEEISNAYKIYYQNNLDGILQQKKEYYIENQNDILVQKKEYIVQKRYRITLYDKQQIYKKQNGLCKICCVPIPMDSISCCIDHNHNTGKIRGILCNRCNFALGMCKDDVLILQAAIRYLTVEKKIYFFDNNKNVKIEYIIGSQEHNINNGLKYRHGIGLENKQQIYNEQNGLCKICSLFMTFVGHNCCIDHDHKTNKIRGLLCGTCNLLLGLFKDDVIILQNAINYLLADEELVLEDINNAYCIDLDL